MFRVELVFDTEHLDGEMLEMLGEQTDRIFEARNMPCESKAVGRRVYTGTGNDKTDFGQLWVALCKIKRTPQIGVWFNGQHNEDLITDFFRATVNG